jgi:hypothetical protein
MRRAIELVVLVLVLCHGAIGQDQKTEAGWRALPLITDDQVDPAWVHTGYGRFTVDNGTLRTDCDPRGLGLLVYTKEQFGDCQIKVVFKTREASSNSGVYIRIDDGMPNHLKDTVPPAQRKDDGSLTPQGAKAMQEASEKEQGPWYAVHHGFEVQIADAGDEWHRTGSIYSLAKAAELPDKLTEWRTMVITLRGQLVEVEVDGKKVTTFDAAAKDLPARKAWHEPKRDAKRPTTGFIGLQNHDPMDVVWFREVSVRKLGQ